MEKAGSLNKTSWFLNPWFDSIFLAGFPTALIIIFLINYPYFNWPIKSFIFYLSFDLYSLLNFPHVISGLSIIYLYQQERKGGSSNLLLTSSLFLLLLIVLAGFGVYYNFSDKLLTFQMLWGSLHSFFQAFFILAIYGLRNNSYPRFDKMVDILFLAAVFFDYQIRTIILKIAGISHIGTGITKPLFISWGIFIYFVVILFIIRQVYLFIRYKKIDLFKIMLLFSSFIVYYSIFMTTRNSLLAWKGQVLLHCFQWIGLIWFFYRQKFKEGIIKGARFISYLSQPGNAKLYFFILIGFSALFNFSYLIFSRQFKIPLNTVTSFIYFPLAILHFFVEIFIWGYFIMIARSWTTAQAKIR